MALLALELARAEAEGASGNSLSELVQDRMSRLDEDAKAVLLWAAVLAPRINLKSLGLVTGLEPGRIDNAIEAAEQQGISLNEGDCALVRTGFGSIFETDGNRYLHDWAGLSPEAVRWLAAKKPRLVGTDNLSLGVPDLFDAHRVLLIENGIYVMKSLNLESLSEAKKYSSTVIVLPLKIKGGEASLIRPIAIA